jgi:hypothetical protein
MSRRAQENLIAVVLFAVFAGFFVMSLGYGPRARLVPLPISVIGMLMIACQLAWQNRRAAGDLRVNVLHMLAGKQGDDIAAAHRSTLGPGFGGPGDTLARNLGAIGIVAALLGLFLLVGPLPAVFAFSFGYFVCSGHCGPARALVYSLACAGIVYGMFGYVLGIQLNRGLLAPYIEQLVHF